MADLAVAPAAPLIRPRLSRDDIVMRLGIAAMVALLAVFVALPLWALLSKSFENADGAFVGLDNYIRYFSTPALSASIENSFFVAIVSTVIVLPLAFVYAYALTRARLPLRPLFQAAALVPILAPSLLPAISLIYLFGNQGVFKGLLFGGTIYGAGGIIVAQVFYCFPHVLMILVTALAMSDGRLYEAASALGASRWRIFWTVTLPGARYGVISAGFVAFTLVITDFGIAKVIGGRFNVLATDVYKQVIGQQNFQMGAVVGLVLLAPAVLAFLVDAAVQRRQVALLSARAVPYEPRPRRGRDLPLLAYCTVVGGAIVGVLGMAVWASFVKRWPYNLSLTFANYNFDEFDPSGWDPVWTSLKMAAAAAFCGALLIFVGAWLLEKSRGFHIMRGLARFLATLPLAVPGMVLGLGYIFFFIAPGNPLNFLYGTLGILIVNSIAHFYTVSHVTAVTALKQIDAEFESVSASLKVPLTTTLVRVTAPICLPAILDIFVYLFANAMTTVSAVIFLYGPETKLAAVAVINMDEAGMTAAAAAMATIIVLVSLSIRLLHLVVERTLLVRLQRWRRR
ncbi:MAG: putative 2-aminoethylphosphonate ABC transporter permease subunit [Alphaproteobacteria bacterium]|nr:putative 2-aminoethylphosphonate ABC transporter permease subunit [Alphaproteobacteria bacterium]